MPLLSDMTTFPRPKGPVFDQMLRKYCRFEDKSAIKSALRGPFWGPHIHLKNSDAHPDEKRKMGIDILPLLPCNR